ncbi:MAG TPA: AAA family ATPase [Pyrinomonadaceae bacterium]|nr:AAA family ATPase [Pyrinomonadaceae bacterium]
MSNVINNTINDTAVGKPLRRACDLMKTPEIEKREMLFDEFWTKGELAILFGEAGIGKSLLAMQIADALTRGRPIVEYLKMPETPLKVLYVDLVLNDAQFCRRYKREAGDGEVRAYEFSENLIYDRPPEGADVAEWIRNAVDSNPLDIVIVDDLSVVSDTDDGTRERLRLLLELRKLSRVHGLSVLVLADSIPSGYELTTEAALRRGRVFCNYADSVFTIDGLDETDFRMIVQTRSSGGDRFWTENNRLYARVSHSASGLLGLVFPSCDRKKNGLPDQILRIKELRDENKMTFRDIAEYLELSKSSVHRLYSMWKPDMDDVEVEEDDEAYKVEEDEEDEEEEVEEEEDDEDDEDEDDDNGDDERLDPDLGIPARYAEPDPRDLRELASQTSDEQIE